METGSSLPVTVSHPDKTGNESVSNLGIRSAIGVQHLPGVGRGRVRTQRPGQHSACAEEQGELVQKRDQMGGCSHV